MGYQSAIRYLYRLEKKGVRLSLGRIRRALLLRGSPQKPLRYVHIAGTNGKGSTAAMVESIARAAGLRTGMFTSPHLHRFNERIRIDGRPLSQAKVAAYLGPIRETLDREGMTDLSFYETTTLLAFETFLREECDLVVLEVGLGGRLDATNVVRPEVSVITHIARDHTRILGNTLAKIAVEKAGIIKRGVPLVSGVNSASAQQAIAEVSQLKHAPTWQLNREVRLRSHDAGFTVTLDGATYSELEAGLPGRHQHHNAALAVSAMHLVCKRPWFRRGEYQWNPVVAKEGLTKSRWPGRLEWIDGAPRVLLDAAHNQSSAKVLAEYLDTLPRKKRVLVFGAMADKDLKPMLRLLAPRVSKIVYVSTGMRRSANTTVLASIEPGERQAGEGKHSVKGALRRATKLAGARGEVIVAGSIFVMAEARANLLGAGTDPLIAM